MDTGRDVAYGGGVPGWAGAGLNAVHAALLAQNDWATMLYGNNTLTLSSGIAANAPGTNYAITFNYGTANYASESQGTTATDGLVVQVLSAATSSVLAQQAYLPSAWGPGDYNLQAGQTGALNYTGDGSGDIEIMISTANPGSDTFGGMIDGLPLTSVPEPASPARPKAFCVPLATQMPM